MKIGNWVEATEWIYLDLGTLAIPAKSNHQTLLRSTFTVDPSGVTYSNKHKVPPLSRPHRHLTLTHTISSLQTNIPQIPPKKSKHRIKVDQPEN